MYNKIIRDDWTAYFVKLYFTKISLAQNSMFACVDPY